MINTKTCLSSCRYQLWYKPGYVSSLSKNHCSNNEIAMCDSGTFKYHLEMSKYHAETNLSPFFKKFRFIVSRTLFSHYGFHLGCEEGHISPIFENLVQKQTNFFKWWNNIAWCWDIILPSRKELISCYDWFLPFI